MKKTSVFMLMLTLMLLFAGCSDALLGSLPEEIGDQPDNICSALPEEPGETSMGTPPSSDPPVSGSSLKPLETIAPPPETLPEVIVQIDKLTDEGFEGVVTESADSYLQRGERVQVVYDWSKCAEAERRMGVASVLFSDFEQREGADLLFADSISFNYSLSPLFDTERSVSRIAISSLPESYSYAFTNVQGRAQIIDYLLDLDLNADFGENPNEYSGMTWVITLYFADGGSTTIYHFGNMFIRAENGPWYKMNYEQANKLSEIVWNLPPEF
ncbi:MAG: hypothetical protein IJX08_08465 [Clostridia bacterium]|nr:hypothetical protein [Clostridia bacterium]